MTSRRTGPASTSNGELRLTQPPPRVDATSTELAETSSIERSRKVATPCEARTVVVPCNVAPPSTEMRINWALSVSLPYSSVAATSIGGVMASQAIAAVRAS